MDGAISDDLIHYCSKQVAEKYHGDARRTLKIIYASTKRAENENSSIITLKHLISPNKL